MYMTVPVTSRCHAVRSPTINIRRRLLIVISLEHFAEVLPQVVARGPLDSSPCPRDVRLHGGRLVASRELFGLRFRAFRPKKKENKKGKESKGNE